VCHLLCGAVSNTCPKTCHKTYFFKVGLHRGVRHILFSSPRRGRVLDRHRPLDCLLHTAPHRTAQDSTPVHPVAVWDRKEYRIRSLEIQGMEVPLMRKY